MTKRLIVTSLALTLALAFVASFVSRVAARGPQAGQTTSLPVLTTAPANELASDGVSLAAPPSNATPAIDASRAASLAVASRSGTPATVREQALAAVHDPNSDIPDGTLAWAVSLMPPGGLNKWLDGEDKPGHPSVAEPPLTGFYVVFVDATTGADLGAVGYGSPVSQ